MHTKWHNIILLKCYALTVLADLYSDFYVKMRTHTLTTFVTYKFDYGKWLIPSIKKNPHTHKHTKKNISNTILWI